MTALPKSIRLPLSYVARFKFHLLLPLLALLATAWAPAPQGEKITVMGQVTNGTPDGTVPADLLVALHVFSEMEETGTYTSAINTDGTFRFDGLTLEGGETLVAHVVYQDVTYFSDLATLEPGQQQLSLPIVIYQTTVDPAAILVTQLHIFLSRAGNRLQVAEYYLVSNAGDRTYVGAQDPETGQRTTLRFALPEGAEGLIFDGPGLGERYLEGEGSFADTEPILPGTATVEVSFSYELSYRQGLRVERALDVPAASAVLLILEDGMALEGAALSPAGTLDTQMGPALSYTAGPLAAGEPLAFTLVDGRQAELPSAPTGTSPARNSAREISIGLVALASAVLTAYLLWRPPAPGPLPARARPLVRDIAALDTEFEAGQVSEKAYRNRRKAFKRRLRALLLQRSDD